MQRHILRIFILIAFLLLAGAAAFSILLPPWIQSSLLPSLVQKAGIDHFNVTPSRIGLTHLQTGFQIGPRENPVLTVASLSADYTLSGLKNKTINQISLNGVELRFAVKNNKLVINDAGLQKLLTASSTDKVQTSEPQPLVPYTVRKIIIRQATLVCTVEDRHFRLPFEAELVLPQPSSDKSSRGQLHIKLYPREQLFLLSLVFNRENMTGDVSFSAQQLDPRRFSDIVHLPWLNEKQRIDVTANASCNLFPFNVLKVKAHSQLANSRFQFGNVSFFPLEEKTAEPPSISVTLSPRQEGWQIDADCSLPDMTAKINETSVTLLSPSLQGKGIFSDGKLSADSQLTLQIKAIHDTFRAELPQLQIRSSASWLAGEKPHFQGVVETSEASFHHLPAQLTLLGGQMNIPVNWPLADKTDEGRLEIKKIKWQDRELGSLDGKIIHEKGLIKLITDFNAGVLPGFSVSSSLSMPVDPHLQAVTHLGVTIPPYTLSDLAVTDFFPDAKELSLSGVISGRADMQFDKILTGEGRFAIAGGKIFLPENNITVSDINTEITFPRLPQIGSLTGQKLHFGSAGLNDLKIDGGSLIYTIESAHSFFLEQGNFNWAKGTVDTYALRFAGKKPPQNMIFYCSKMNLATILAQLGIENISGDGTVNGRIPFALQDGNLTFGQSFLYSTPGEGGIIKVGDKDFLTRAIPINTPQFSQLDFAQEALRNFSYSWAKVHIANEDDMLVLQLQLDGKPAKPLPFSYDTRTGAFRRLQDKNVRGMSQPIRLDVNFRFPLNTLMDYDRNIKDLLEQIR